MVRVRFYQVVTARVVIGELRESNGIEAPASFEAAAQVSPFVAVLAGADGSPSQIVHCAAELDQTAPDRLGDGLHATSRLQAALKQRDQVLDRPFRVTHTLGDLAGGIALGQELEHESRA